MTLFLIGVAFPVAMILTLITALLFLASKHLLGAMLIDAGPRPSRRVEPRLHPHGDCHHG
jgi:hypothetical protein